LGREKRTRAKPNAQKSRVSAVFGDRSDPRTVCLSRKGSKSKVWNPAHLPTPHLLPTLLCFGAARVLGYSHQVPGPPFLYMKPKFFFYTLLGRLVVLAGRPSNIISYPKIIWSFLICPWPGGVTLVYTYSPETTRICHATQRNTTQHNNPVYCNCIPSCCVRIHSVYGRFSRASVEPAVR
jgi:hypothetical protein